MCTRQTSNACAACMYGMPGVVWPGCVGEGGYAIIWQVLVWYGFVCSSSSWLRFEPKPNLKLGKLMC